MTGLVHHYGLLALFLLVMLESSGVPLPGETALITAGIFASRGDLVIEEVIIVAAAGAIVGDNIGYWLGREGGNRLLDGVGPLKRWSAPSREGAERFFQRHGAKTIFIARFVAVLRVSDVLVGNLCLSLDLGTDEVFDQAHEVFRVECTNLLMQCPRCGCGREVVVALGAGGVV